MIWVWPTLLEVGQAEMEGFLVGLPEAKMMFCLTNWP